MAACCILTNTLIQTTCNIMTDLISKIIWHYRICMHGFQRSCSKVLVPEKPSYLKSPSNLNSPCRWPIDVVFGRLTETFTLLNTSWSYVACKFKVKHDLLEHVHFIVLVMVTRTPSTLSANKRGRWQGTVFVKCSGLIRNLPYGPFNYASLRTQSNRVDAVAG